MKVWKIGNMAVVRVNVSISKEQYRFVKDNHISLSSLVRAAIDTKMKK